MIKMNNIDELRQDVDCAMSRVTSMVFPYNNGLDITQRYVAMISVVWHLKKSINGMGVDISAE